ncbi:MAG TPA: hypothetical protein VH880_09335, partial [Anaeromyxobacteraceae bacterium]
MGPLDAAPPVPEAGRPPAARGRIAACALLAAWTALLAAGVLEPRSPLAAAGLAALRSSSGLAALARGLLAWSALEALRFAPLGVLAVLALPERGRLRPWRGALAAAGLGTACALAALGIAGRSVPSPFAASLPAAGAVLGTAAGLAWRKGGRTRLLFLPGLAALAAAALLAAAGLLWLALEPGPRVAVPAPVTSSDKRAIVAAVRGKNPRRVPPGETRTLRLGARDLERLAAWGFAVRGGGRGTVALEGPGRASAAVSLQLPRTGGRWLNVAAAVSLAVVDGKVDLAIPSLQIGPWSVPSPVLRVLSAGLVGAAAADGRVHGVLRSIRMLRIDAEGVTLAYERVDLEGGLLSRVVWGEDQVGAVRDAVAPHVRHLLEVLPRSPRGDARFA